MHVPEIKIKSAEDLMAAAREFGRNPPSKLERPVRIDALYQQAKQAGIGPSKTRKDIILKGIKLGEEDAKNEKLKRFRPSKEKQKAIFSGDLLLKPVIEYRPDEMTMGFKRWENAALEANKAKGELGPEMFQRGGYLVLARHVPATGEPDENGRKPGTSYIWTVSKDTLIYLMAQKADWQKYDGRVKEFVPCAPPEALAKAYLASPEWRMPVLNGITGCPTIRPDGTILDKPGYDEATGLYLIEPGNIKFLPVLESPTKEDAEAALRRLLIPLEEFPFTSEASRSVAVAAILTAIARPALRTAPLICFTAPVMRSGKSLLADCTALIATGKTCENTTHTTDEPETKKRITAFLREGATLINIDNVEDSLASVALSAVLTSDQWRDRVLGKTESVILPTKTTWLATGNNIIIKGDLSVRTIICTIDPGVEHPEERRFNRNVREYVLEHRAELIQAALTILRAYHIAGKPDVGTKPFGGFDEWASTIRDPLVWLEMADPVSTRDKVLSADPDRELLRTVLETWHELFGALPLTTAELIEEARNKPILEDVLTPVCMNRSDGLNSRRLGRWLAKYEGRIANGFKIIQGTSTSKKVSTWRVEPQK